MSKIFLNDFDLIGFNLLLIKKPLFLLKRKSPKNCQDQKSMSRLKSHVAFFAFFTLHLFDITPKLNVAYFCHSISF